MANISGIKEFGNKDYNKIDEYSFNDISRASTNTVQVNSSIPAVEEMDLSLNDKKDKSLGKTVLFGLNSIFEGAISVGENVRDAVEITGTKAIGKAMMKVGYIDKDIYDEMMEETKANVAINYVKESMDDINQKEGLTGNVYGENTVRAFGNGVGKTAEIIALSLAGGIVAKNFIGGTALSTSTTTGATNVATKIFSNPNTYSKITRWTTAGISGMGDGTQRAYQKGATVEDGLKAGYASGLWDAAQWMIGEKINTFNPFKGGTQVVNQIKNSVTHVALDAVDAGAEGLVQPLIEKIYSDKGYKEIFKEYGGWGNVGTQALIGGTLSSVAEIGNVKAVARQDVIDTNVKNTDINADMKYKSNQEKIIVEMGDQTSKVFQIDELVSIVNDKNKLNKLKNYNFDKKTFTNGTREEYLSALEQFLTAIEKNNYDFNISKSRIKNVYDVLEKSKNISQQKLTLSVPSKDINATAKLFQVNELLDILDDSYKLSNLQEYNFDRTLFKNGTREQYIQAIEQLLNATKKNNYGIEINLKDRSKFKKILKNAKTTSSNLNKYGVNAPFILANHKENIDGIFFTSNSKEGLESLKNYYFSIKNDANNNIKAQYFIENLGNKNVIVTDIGAYGNQCSYQRGSVLFFDERTLSANHKSVFFHEAGHLVDSYNQNYQVFMNYFHESIDRISSDSIQNIEVRLMNDYRKFSKNLDKVIETDIEVKKQIEENVDFKIKQNFSNFSDKEYKELIEHFKREEIDIYKEREIRESGLGSISDIVDALTEGRLGEKGFLGHGVDYYQNSNVAFQNRSAEVLANVSSLYNAGQIDRLYNYLPRNSVNSLIQGYEEIMGIRQINETLTTLKQLYDTKCGEGSFNAELLEYAKDGNLNRFGNDNLVKNELQKITNTQLKQYLTSYEQVNSQLTKAMKSMDSKYGNGTFNYNLNAYLNDGNIKHITRDGGARALVELLSQDQLKLFIAGNL